MPTRSKLHPIPDACKFVYICGHSLVMPVLKGTVYKCNMCMKNGNPRAVTARITNAPLAYLKISLYHISWGLSPTPWVYWNLPGKRKSAWWCWHKSIMNVTYSLVKFVPLYRLPCSESSWWWLIISEDVIRCSLLVRPLCAGVRGQWYIWLGINLFGGGCQWSLRQFIGRVRFHNDTSSKNSWFQLIKTINDYSRNLLELVVKFHDGSHSMISWRYLPTIIYEIERWYWILPDPFIPTQPTQPAHPNQPITVLH